MYGNTAAKRHIITLGHKVLTDLSKCQASVRVSGLLRLI